MSCWKIITMPVCYWRSVGYIRYYMIDFCRFHLWNTAWSHQRCHSQLTHEYCFMAPVLLQKKGTFTGHSPKTLDVDVCVSDWLWSPNRQHLLNSFIQIDTRGSEKYRRHPFQLMHSFPQLPHKTPSRSCADRWSKVNPSHTLAHCRIFCWESKRAVGDAMLVKLAVALLVLSVLEQVVGSDNTDIHDSLPEKPASQKGRLSLQNTGKK